MKKTALVLLASLLIICGFASPGLSSPGVQVDASSTVVSKYNSIATYDPVNHSAKFYESSALVSGALPNASWINENSAAIEFAAPEEQGVYNVCSNDCSDIAPLVVSATPGRPVAQTVVIVPDFTWQAYNPVGGGSLYGTSRYTESGQRIFPFGVDAQHPNGQHAKDQVTVDRPLEVTLPDGHHWDQVPTNNPIKFFRESSTPVDVISQTALNTYDYDLAQYKTIILYGHDEYWTKSELNEISAAVQGGTNLLNLSGNTGFRRVIFTNGVLSFEQNARGDDLSELPQTLGNPVIQMLGVRYLFYPLKRLIEDSGKPFSDVHYQKLLSQGLPEQIPMQQALASTSGVWLPEKSSPLFAGVETDQSGFFGITSSVQNVEIDGVPLTDSGEVTASYREILGLQEADILGQSWAGFPASLKSPTSSRMGLLVAKFFGKGRVISAGSVGWVRALIEAKDDAVIKITENSLRILATEPNPAKSKVVWTRSKKTANKWTRVGAITIAEHERANVSAPCTQQKAKPSCALKVVDGSVYLKLTSSKQTVRVLARITGDTNFRISVRPRDISFLF